MLQTVSLGENINCVSKTCCRMQYLLYYAVTWMNEQESLAGI